MKEGDVFRKLLLREINQMLSDISDMELEDDGSGIDEIIDTVKELKDYACVFRARFDRRPVMKKIKNDNVDINGTSGDDIDDSDNDIDEMDDEKIVARNVLAKFGDTGLVYGEFLYFILCEAKEQGKVRSKEVISELSDKFCYEEGTVAGYVYAALRYGVENNYLVKKGRTRSTRYVPGGNIDDGIKKLGNGNSEVEMEEMENVLKKMSKEYIQERR